MCPELLVGAPGSAEAVEARLDLHLWAPQEAGASEAWVDVTTTHPFQQKCRDKAAVEDGVAAKAAENRKRQRYGGGVGGVVVQAFAVELWGRHGVQAEELLSALAAAWAERHGCNAAKTATTLRRWRAEIGIAVVRAIAATAAMASARDRGRADTDNESGIEG